MGRGPTSALSSTIVAQVQTVPLKPSVALQVDAANTNQQQIKVMWSAITGVNDGGSEVLSYNL